jgi:glycosyltransferase involved in cell wall biosynthesis
MRIAVVHDWFCVPGGGERVVEQILRLLPVSAVYALFDFCEHREFLRGHSVQTSVLQRFPFARKYYRHYLPLMPLAVEQFDLAAYDLVISSSHAVAKGVLTGPNQLHISYVHTPMRYAWDLTAEYLRDSEVSRGVRNWLARLIFHYIRQWDQAAANRVDRLIANSRYVARRIRKCYRRNAEVIYPPVDTARFTLETDKDDYYFTAGRMVPYKRMDLIVEAFARMPNRKLIVVGDGPEAVKVRSKLAPNITLLEHQPAAVLRDYLQRARAFVFAAEEDFGILPVEAQACGTPVIAFGKGGALETVVDQSTGLFYSEQSAACLVDAVERFERLAPLFDPQGIREHAERFGIDRFELEFAAFVDREWDRFTQRSNLRQHPAHADGRQICVR